MEDKMNFLVTAELVNDEAIEKKWFFNYKYALSYYEELESSGESSRLYSEETGKPEKIRFISLTNKNGEIIFSHYFKPELSEKELLTRNANIF